MPPTELELKEIWDVAGKPLGLAFPKASFAVRVATRVLPEATVAAETVTLL